MRVCDTSLIFVARKKWCCRRQSVNFKYGVWFWQRNEGKMVVSWSLLCRAAVKMHWEAIGIFSAHHLIGNNSPGSSAFRSGMVQKRKCVTRYLVRPSFLSEAWYISAYPKWEHTRVPLSTLFGSWMDSGGQWRSFQFLKSGSFASRDLLIALFNHQTCVVADSHWSS